MNWMLGFATAATTTTVQVDATLPLAWTGLWLKEGQKVTVRAEGAWTMWADQWPDATADGYADAQHHGCALGALVAHVGLGWADRDTPVCLGRKAALVAPRDGYLWLGPNDGVASDNGGGLTVELRTRALPTEPLVADAVRAGVIAGEVPEWLVHGDHVSVLLPRTVVVDHGGAVADALAVMDRMVEAEAAVLGALPYDGRRILFVPDEGVRELGLMVAGNPVRFLPEVLGEGEDISFLHLGDPSWSHWSWAHELGHDFTVDVGFGQFMIGPGFVEAWANVPGLAALRALELPEADLRHPSHAGWKDGYPEAPAATPDLPPEPCTAVPAYLASGSWPQLEADPWLALCMLFELQEAHGADVLERFTRSWTHEEARRWPGHDAPVDVRWAFFAQAFEEATGADPRPTLARWHVPMADLPEP